MNKSFIPYHLRQNKSIDRNLFIGLLSMLNRYFLIKEYEYISMGGAFLEDFKVVHGNTGIRKMISFEMDENTFTRQKFNLPLNCINLKLISSSDFIMEYDFPRKSIIWLDFTTPSRMSSDLNDVFQLVGKLKRGDILKVTLNAHVASLNSDGAASELEKKGKRYEYLENLIGDYLPADINPDMITTKRYPQVLFDTLKLTIDKGIGAMSNLFFQPLSSFLYSDGMQMMTFTGVILEKSELKDFRKTTMVHRWKLSIFDRTSPLSINIPDLSVKERIFLDSLLPKHTPRVIQRKLKYLLANNEQDSIDKIENYVNYYKEFPYFSKIVI